MFVYDSLLEHYQKRILRTGEYFAVKLTPENNLSFRFSIRPFRWNRVEVIGQPLPGQIREAVSLLQRRLEKGDEW